MSPGQLWRTARHLRPVQVYGRAWFRLHRPQPRLDPAPPRRRFADKPAFAAWRPPSLLGPDRVRFLNREAEIGGQGSWTDPGHPRLWRYNLHYFDDLSAVEWEARGDWHRRLIDRWIDENPPGQGDGWEPYPASLRIVNWIKWSLSGGALSDRAVHSLAVQLRWLEQRLEHHLLGNHLLANAKALAFGGSYFAGAEGDRWLRKARRLLARELREQVLADGAHFERSPMYHAIILEDVLDLLALQRSAGEVICPDLEQSPGPMLEWLAALTHPDGRIAFFNDAAFGIAPELSDLARYASELGLESNPASPRDARADWRAASGYARLQQGAAVALLDLAPVGPDYLPGHAHADTLSFEFSLGVERVIVNGGTSGYGEDARRQVERSTHNHSTVEVAGENSSEVWAGFRVGRRARVFDATVEARSDGAHAAAAHDGYRWLPGSPRHRRAWTLTAERLVVEDRIEGGTPPAVARFHLAPGVRPVLSEDDRSVALTLPSGGVLTFRTGAPVSLEPFEWAPEFGRRLPTHSLVAPLAGGELRSELSW